VAVDTQVQLANVERLRESDPLTVQVLVQDLVRLHIQRIAPTCVADMFAVSEAELPATLAADLKGWAGRAGRELLDLPVAARRLFLAPIGDLPPAAVPATLRDAIGAMVQSADADTAAFIGEMQGRWAEVPPRPVVIAVRKGPGRSGPKTTAGGDTIRKVVGAPRQGGVARTPVADVDPRRAAYIRTDALESLKPWGDRGIKESVLVGGIRHRSPFKDLTEAEVRSELRRMARERQVKQTGERWRAL
jgi:hypothetical protein